MDGVLPDRGYPLAIPTGRWTVIDALLDNSMNIDIMDLEAAERVPALRSIRKAGWDAIPRGNDKGHLASWPPDDQPIVVMLTGRQWELLLSLLNTFAEEAVEDDEEEEARKIRDLRGLVAHELTQHQP